MATPEGLAEFAAAAASGNGDDAAPEPKAEPAALRAKGIDDDASTPALTYVGPSEDGTAAVQHRDGAAAPAAAAGGTRKQRREAARKAGKGSRRG